MHCAALQPLFYRIFYTNYIVEGLWRCNDVMFPRHLLDDVNEKCGEIAYTFRFTPVLVELELQVCSSLKGK
jgi:hypothetical protein